MNPKEIRIGNFTYLDNGTNLMTIAQLRDRFASVDYIRTDTNTPHQSMVEYERLVGIPLTKEWLLNFNCHKDNYGLFLKTKDNTYTSKSKVEFWIKQCIIKGECKYDFSVGKKFSSTRNLCYINYVHQLQNIYWCIYGKELTLKNQ